MSGASDPAAGSDFAPAPPAAASSDASTHDAIRTSSESWRVGTTTGTRAPTTIPAARPPATASSVRSTMSALSIEGPIRTSARPAMSDFTPLPRAASADSALSGASGPSTTAPWNSPCIAMAFSATASVVERNAGAGPSIAASSATAGDAMPRAVARWIVFCTMSRLAARLGATFMYASASSRPRGCPGRSRKYACDSRRSVRSPDSGAATGPSRSSLPRLPRTSAATAPSRASSAARTPALRGSSSVPTIGSRAMSSPDRSAASRMRASGPTSVGAR